MQEMQNYPIKSAQQQSDLDKAGYSRERIPDISGLGTHEEDQWDTRYSVPRWLQRLYKSRKIRDV